MATKGILLSCAVVLCRPEESRNIGSVCRAMKNMGFSDLRVVGDRDDFNENQVKTLALGAFDVWENASFFPPDVSGLAAAVSDCSLAAGTTRRRGKRRKAYGLSPEQFASNIVATHSGGKIAVVFGNERTGLTDDELDVCSLSVSIPSNPRFASLNLSHAVQVVLYVLARSFDSVPRGYEPVPLSRLKSAVAGMAADIRRVGLYKYAGGEDNARFLEEVFARATLSERELRRLELLFHKIAYIKTSGESKNTDAPFQAARPSECGGSDEDPAGTVFPRGADGD